MRLPGGESVELTVVAGMFEAAPDRAGALGAVLAHYVVLTRAAAGCRNVDLVASLTTPGRFLVYEKWETPSHQRVHLDSAIALEMARAASPLLVAPPDLGLYEPVSAHDLR